MEHAFFKPRYAKENWHEGSGTLVVGISHYCYYRTEECKYYEDCVLGCHSDRYDVTCEHRGSEVEDSEYPLSESTDEAFKCYFEGFSGYHSFKEFMLFMTGQQDFVGTSTDQAFWNNNVAYYNYIQHFTGKALTHISNDVADELAKDEDRDFKALCEVLHELKPRLVVVWHKDIKDILLKRSAGGEIGEGRRLTLIDDLGMPTRSMFRFAYSEETQSVKTEEVLEAFKNQTAWGEQQLRLSPETAMLRLLRTAMYPSIANTLLNDLPFTPSQLTDMLNATQEHVWDESLLQGLTLRLLQEKNIDAVFDEPYLQDWLPRQEGVVYSNIFIPSTLLNQKAKRPSSTAELHPLMGIHPSDTALFSIERHKERTLLQLTGFRYDRLTCCFTDTAEQHSDKTQIPGSYNILLYLDEDYTYEASLFTQLFACRDAKSILIITRLEDNPSKEGYQVDKYLRFFKDNQTCLKSLVQCGKCLFIDIDNQKTDKRFTIFKDEHWLKVNGDMRKYQLKSLVPANYEEAEREEDLILSSQVRPKLIKLGFNKDLCSDLAAGLNEALSQHVIWCKQATPWLQFAIESNYEKVRRYLLRRLYKWLLSRGQETPSKKLCKLFADCKVSSFVNGKVNIDTLERNEDTRKLIKKIDEVFHFEKAHGNI